MADLGVAHLPVGQADVAALGGERGVRDSASQSSSKTGVSAREIALPGPGRREPPAVEDDQRDARGPARSRGPARHAASAGGLDDRGEVVGVEARAADQGAVDVRLRRAARRRCRA